MAPRKDPQSRNAGVVQNEIQDSAYNARHQIAEQVQMLFGDFGPKVCSYLLTQTLTNGGIERVLQKLGLQSRNRLGADHALIEAWIREHGVDEFGKKVGIRLVDSQVDEEPPKPRKGADPETLKGVRIRKIDKPRELSPPGEAEQEASRPETPPQSREQAPMRDPVTGAENQPRPRSRRPDAPPKDDDSTGSHKVSIRNAGVKPVKVEQQEKKGRMVYGYETGEQKQTPAKDPDESSRGYRSRPGKREDRKEE